MATATRAQTGVCPEYRILLDHCQKALVTWQQHRTHAERVSLAGKSTVEELNRLQANYARAYARLESHEQSCAICQYVAKIAGLDFESMSTALNRHRRIG